MSAWDRDATSDLGTLAARVREGLADRMRSVAERFDLAQALALALVLRLAVLTFATPAHPDEVFQYLETAHRLVFGQGIVTWEWREGIRGWLLPLATSLPMRVGAWIDPGGPLYLIAPKALMVLASLTTVVVAWRLGERISRFHAQWAGFIAATWFEFIYFAPHVLSETLSIALILPAALVLVAKDRWTGRRIGLAAALLSCAVAVRFQNAPAVTTLVLACCATDLRRTWRPLLLGGLLGLAPSALCDLSQGATPFLWVFENIRLNLVEHRAEGFSSSGPLGFATEIWPRLALWTVPLLVLAAVGARRYPALAWMAVANLLFHSVIAHKEYRFILLSTCVAVILAAIGTADWIGQVTRKDGEAAGRSKLEFLLLAWVLASLSCGLGGFRIQWLKFKPEMDLFARERSDPALCGLAIYRHDFSVTGGYAYLHRPVPILLFNDEANPAPQADLARAAGEFNIVMVDPERVREIPAAFKQLDCETIGKQSLCLYRRPGTCIAPERRYLMNAVLQRFDR